VVIVHGLLYRVLARDNTRILIPLHLLITDTYVRHCLKTSQLFFTLAFAVVFREDSTLEHRGTNGQSTYFIL